MKDLIRAMRRLETSQTRLTRKRARRAVRAACTKLLKAFPPMNKDGKAITKRGCACPLCRIPCKSWADLARHLARKHCHRDKGNKGYCPACGEYFISLGGHLASLHRQGKLLQHVVAGASQTAFGDSQ